MLQILFEVLVVQSLRNVTENSVFYSSLIHRAYLVCVLSFFYISYRYMADFVKQEVGVEMKNWEFIHVAQFLGFISVFLLPVGSLDQNGRYIYGPGMWIVYVAAAFYLLIVFSNYCGYYRHIAKEKIRPLVWSTGLGILVCVFYMIFPQSMMAALGIVVINLGMYASQVECTTENGAIEGEIETIVPAKAYKVTFEAPQARILIVDDSSINCRVFKSLLLTTKMQIESAESGKECLERIKEKPYDIIFMDHMMPQMDGIETLNAIRKMRRHYCKKTPVVALSANGQPGAREEYIKHGFCDYLPKPIIPHKLEVLVFELLDPKLITNYQKEEIKEEEEPKVEQVIKPKADDSVSEVTKETTTLPMIDGLDYNYAGLHFPDQESMIETICFLTTVMKSDADEIQRYYEEIEQEENLSQFAIKVHSMKNSVSTIGIIPLAGLAKILEDAARKEDIAQIHTLTPVFMEKWEWYRQLLDKNFGIKAEEKKAGDPDSKEIKELFARLREAAQEMDIDLLDDIMKEIDGYWFGPEYEEQLQKLRLAVMNFDIEYVQEEGYLR